jgi:hypothetical protein
VVGRREVSDAERDHQGTHPVPERSGLPRRSHRGRDRREQRLHPLAALPEHVSKPGGGEREDHVVDRGAVGVGDRPRLLQSEAHDGQAAAGTHRSVE